MKTVKAIINTLRKHKSFLIISHDNLDGDAAGSALALALALKKMRKRVQILLSGPVPEQFRFLPGIDSLTIKRIPPQKSDVSIVLDTASREQIVKWRLEQFQSQIIVNIDHHIDNKKFGRLNWVQTTASAVGEQIHQLLKTMKIPITKEIALCLYTAISTDTGQFRFSNTTAATHRITADLLKSGVKPATAVRQLYEKFPLCRLRLLQLALTTLSSDSRGEIIWLWLTNNMFKRAKAKRELAIGFIDLLKAISGVKVAIIFKDTPRRREKRETFRSKDPRITVNTFARQFGGGGHPAAAGCNVYGNRREAEKKVLRAVKKALKKSG